MAASASTALALDQIELDANRALWNSHNITNYDLVEGFVCFCPPEATRPALLAIRAGSIVSALDAQTHQPISPADFLTVDHMFDRLQFALDFDTSPYGHDLGLWIEAQFDPHLGYPRHFRIDDPGLLDDDYSYGILELTVVPEPAGRTLLLVAPLAALSVTRRNRRQLNDDTPHQRDR